MADPSACPGDAIVDGNDGLANGHTALAGRHLLAYCHTPLTGVHALANSRYFHAAPADAILQSV